MQSTCIYVHRCVNKTCERLHRKTSYPGLHGSGGERLLLRVGNKSRNIGNKWETLLGWVHVNMYGT